MFSWIAGAQNVLQRLVTATITHKSLPDDTWKFKKERDTSFIAINPGKELNSRTK